MNSTNLTIFSSKTISFNSSFNFNRIIRIRHPWYSLLFLVALQVIIANLILMRAVLQRRCLGLRSSTNYFILSLAVADLIVGVLVMPFGVIALMTRNWLFTSLWCDLWQTFDFFACSASIFNLCAISCDRYLAISHPFRHTRLMRPRLVLIGVLFLWILAALITFPPMLIRRWINPTSKRHKCTASSCACLSIFNQPLYVLFSSMVTFFLPLLAMLIVNWRTYRIARSKLRPVQLGQMLNRKESNQIDFNHKTNSRVTFKRGCHNQAYVPSSSQTLSSQSMQNDFKTLPNSCTPFIIESAKVSKLQDELTKEIVAQLPDDESCSINVSLHSDDCKSEKQLNLNATCLLSNQTSSFKFSKYFQTRRTLPRHLLVWKQSSIFSHQLKATKTLTIIMGVFVICWLPYYSLVTIWALWPQSPFQPNQVFPITLWLGWSNSFFDPIIWLCLSSRFRKTFLSSCPCTGCATRTGSENNLK